MADQNYPQLPSAVWWKVRDAFKRKIPGKVTNTYLASILNVKEGAARIYLRDLKSTGLVKEDGSPSDLVVDWRDDEKYPELSEQMFNSIYPDELRASAPAPDPDRKRVARWFMQNLKIGEGAAANKATFYVLLASGELQKSVQITATAKRKDNTQPRVSRVAAATLRSAPSAQSSPAAHTHIEPNIQLNIQIHISADATNEQIDAIFASMATHLRPR
jgi:hypothetical protein